MKRYKILWTNGREDYGSTLETKAEAEALLNYIETQATLELIEYREIG